jgi:hypothetical protein
MKGNLIRLPLYDVKSPALHPCGARHSPKGLSLPMDHAGEALKDGSSSAAMRGLRPMGNATRAKQYHRNSDHRAWLYRASEAVPGKSHTP